MDDPGERRPLKSLLTRIRKRIDAISDFGADSRLLIAKFEETESLFVKGKEREARLVADELLIFLKILTSEVDRITSEFVAGKAPPPSPGEGAPDGKVLDMVREAFQRSLHSAAMRRMVETIALEKVQALMSGEFVQREEFEELKQSLPKTIESRT